MADVKLTEFDRFAPVCALHGTTPQAARIVICKGRKVGFVLSYGSVPSPACFLNERPTKSTKDSDVLDMLLIPHQWKIALEVKRTIYMGETVIRGSGPPLYRFSRIDGDTGQSVDQSELKEHPTSAFSEVAQRAPSGVAAGQQQLADTERPNGKLYMGVQYTEPQLQLRKRRDALHVSPDAMAKFLYWANLEPNHSTAATAPAVGVDSPKFAGKRKLGAASATDSSSSSSSSSASTLRHIGHIVQHTIDNEEDIRSELDLVSSRPSKLQREGSLRGAMKLLRENSLELTPDDLEFDQLDVKSAGKMSAEALFYAFKNPASNHLNLAQMRRAMETLLQMPCPKRLVEETFAACDTERTGRVTLQNFVRVIQQRDEELWQQFCRIDYDGDGEITLDELRLAKQSGLFSAQERELDTLLEAMDRVSSREGDHAFVDQKIQWHEFRAMMVLLPPASTIQVIVDVVKAELEERDLLSDAAAFAAPSSSSSRNLLSPTRPTAAAAAPPPPRPGMPAPLLSQRSMDFDALLFMHEFGGGSGEFVIPPQHQQPQHQHQHQQQQLPHFFASPALPAYMTAEYGMISAPPPPPPLSSTGSGSGRRAPFERSSSFQQYPVRQASPYLPNAAVVVAPPPPPPPSSLVHFPLPPVMSSGGAPPPPPPHMGGTYAPFPYSGAAPLPMPPSMHSAASMAAAAGMMAVDPYREIFGRDAEFETIFEDFRD